MDTIWRRQPHGSSTPRGIAKYINGVNRERVTTLSTPPVQSCPDKVVNRMGRQPQGVLATYSKHVNGINRKRVTISSTPCIQMYPVNVVNGQRVTISSTP